MPTPHRVWLPKLVLFTALTAIAFLLYLLISDELQSSRLQARFISPYASELNFTVAPGISPTIRFPEAGPFDERRGYTRIPEFIRRLDKYDYNVSAQSRFSPELMSATQLGLFPPYLEKAQTGLALLDCNDQPLFARHYPRHIYDKFNAIPELIVKSLLYIEDRKLLDDLHPMRNPAVEWGRFSKAAYDQIIQLVDKNHNTSGGSTLATQIEKYRHSPQGLTVSRNEKIRQMASASLRAYRNDKNTLPARQQIALDYLNTVPLSGKAGYGEVNGLGDGLRVWYGRNFEYVNRLLQNTHDNDNTHFARKALAYKQALSLIVAQRRPSYYLGDGISALQKLTDSHLRLLANANIISTKLRDTALPLKLKLQNEPVQTPSSFVARKASSALRIRLSSLLDVQRLYDLDRYDLTVGSTLNSRAQNATVDLLEKIKSPAGVREAGLYGRHLFQQGDDLSKAVISFTLYERGEDANFLRVQTDNYDQPFDINEGSKLDMGSTAKLRTLITYLEIIAKLHQRYSNMTSHELREITVDKRNVLTRWSLDYLMSTKDNSLKNMLEAAMNRPYSANSAESFFTGGGLHTFQNFRPEDNNRVMPLREGFRNSVNLVFIRLMRDVVRHYMFQTPGVGAKLLEDSDDPRRRAYLAKFADREGSEFIYRFYKKYQGKSPAAARELLMQSSYRSGKQLATLLRSINPSASIQQFNLLMRDYPAGKSLSDQQLEMLYQQYAPEKWSLADRGYLSGVHPLELWLLEFLQQNPSATRRQVITASREQRQEVYAWLFNAHSKNKQDVRILSLLEAEGFLKILHAWQKLGYPFELLTPSYATALGSSGDRPAALAELMGIIVNKGIRKPAIRIEKMNFAEGTPYETRLELTTDKQERVISEEVAEVVRNALIDVVENGTAIRLKGTFKRNDNQVIAVGGKTGTGDHHFDTYDSHGQLINSRTVNRSAIFVFLIGDQFFGTMTAYVPGEAAANFQFTSTLSVQLLKTLAPALIPMLENQDAVAPNSCRRPH